MTDIQFQNPDALVGTDWLADHLGDDDLRLFDCTFYLQPTDEEGVPYRVVSGRENYLAGHIPGAGFLDLQADFSDPDSPYRFTLLSIADTAAAFARHGIDQKSRVVLYSDQSMSRASRFWWMLRWIGFDRAALLDGGLDKWRAEGRPLDTGESTYPPGELIAGPRPEIFVGKEKMQAAIGADDAVTINALDAALHSGADDRYGRPGRIPDSVNVPAAVLTDPESMALRAPSELADDFSAVGAAPEKRALVYCGGGIAASLDAFVLHQLGYRRIAVYDNSMSEWANDPELPIETD